MASNASSPVCTTLSTCLAYGKVSCDRGTQECPPCIYIDAKGRHLCYARITGTALCPFVNTTADCSASNDTAPVPILVNKTTTPGWTTTIAPNATIDDASSDHLTPLDTGLIVAVVVLALALGITIVVFISKHRYRPGVPYVPKGNQFRGRDVVHVNHPALQSNQHNFRSQPGSTHDCLMSLNPMHTPVLGEPTTLSACYSHESPVWRMSTSSNIMT
ncbi:hypothetical protein H310_13344 [Aphanomyces invadans]|uniref:Uncharacterized protein n=1 Tax=Aphanomyces invadans TaxID=157072 RepID=A0A024TE11_9STRA|nr:hypothetical protein H310_13344 [Aphanomyces invadans]ETV92283.1 hypothetical protein H310_13344 [Aphanomyces invadans]|eukprot:XP_008879034.1 hypothetical protein H310_13344 [Aphanomyces invadans]